MILDYDPVTKMKTVYKAEPDGTTSIYYEQDVEAELEACKSLANDEDYSKRGIKEGWWHYGHIPDVIITKWLKEGFNIYSYGSGPEIAKRLNRDYPLLKVTTKTHEKLRQWI